MTQRPHLANKIRKMNRSVALRVFLIAIISVYFIKFIAVVVTSKKESKQAALTVTDRESTHDLKFYDEKLFYDGVSKAQNAGKNTYRLVGGITPHHLLPSFMLADFYHRLKDQDVHSVIIVGPNHYEKGKYKIATSLRAWKTPFGPVSPNIKDISELIGLNGIGVDEDVLENDHAVASSMPYIKFYLPDAYVVPLLLSAKLNDEDLNIISNSIGRLVRNGAILVAAVDFSHYLTNEEAQVKDVKSEKLIRNFDTRQIESLGNDYLDSSPSIVLLLKVMDILKARNMEIYYHTNSGEMEKNDMIQTTSYFSIGFYE